MVLGDRGGFSQILGFVLLYMVRCDIVKEMEERNFEPNSSKSTSISGQSDLQINVEITLNKAGATINGFWWNASCGSVPSDAFCGS